MSICCEMCTDDWCCICEGAARNCPEEREHPDETIIGASEEQA